MIGWPWSYLLSLSASDLVMKVDALLAAAPKGEVRRDVHFIKDSHRWAMFFPYLLSSCYWGYLVGSENCCDIISSTPERQNFCFELLLNKGCMTLCPFWHAVLLLSVLQFSPRENEVFYDVVAIVDPLTREAQKMSSLLTVSFILVSPLIWYLIWLGGLKMKGRAQKHKAKYKNSVGSLFKKIYIWSDKSWWKTVSLLTT